MSNTAARPDDIKPVQTSDQVIAPAPQLNEFEWKRMIEVRQMVIPELCTWLLTSNVPGENTAARRE